MKRITVAQKPPVSLFALAAMASNTGCTSDGELAITFNIAAVAACCSRAALRSLAASETGRLTRVAAGATRRRVLAALRRLSGLAVRPFALPVLPPGLDGRLICAPRVETRILSGHTVLQEGPDRAKSRLRWGASRVMDRHREPAGGCPFRLHERTYRGHYGISVPCHKWARQHQAPAQLRRPPGQGL